MPRNSFQKRELKSWATHEKPQESLSLADVGVDASQVGDAGSKTEVLALGAPPPRGETVKIEDDGSGAEKIADFLAEKRLL